MENTSTSTPDVLFKVMGELKLTEIDISTKTPGRIDTILVKEGDFVKAGEVLATMDTRTLKEQLHEVQAQLGAFLKRSVMTAESALFSTSKEWESCSAGGCSSAYCRA